MAAGAAAIAVGGRLVDAPTAYHNVSTMPANLGDEPAGPITNPIFRGPERFRYYSVAPVPTFSRPTWRLKVEGLVDRGLVFAHAPILTRLRRDHTQSRQS